MKKPIVWKSFVSSMADGMWKKSYRILLDRNLSTKKDFWSIQKSFFIMEGYFFAFSDLTSFTPAAMTPMRSQKRNIFRG